MIHRRERPPLERLYPRTERVLAPAGGKRALWERTFLFSQPHGKHKAPPINVAMKWICQSIKRLATCAVLPLQQSTVYLTTAGALVKRESPTFVYPFSLAWLRRPQRNLANLNTDLSLPQ